MNADTEAFIKRIASGESTEADAEKVKAFVEAFDAWCQVPFGDTWARLLDAREALK